ncbi:MAG TPA: aminotransferase class III-fold pyridoxal phosphate-dependent enzyme, partial [Usitatibacter sp.]|nr:aminotransferase class III-fold pyridoxal phosphate-dependent enzyme [Usitatibacter sp.]
MGSQPHAANREMIERTLAAVWHPCTQMKSHERYPLLPVARAEGPWIYDFEGRRYLDAVSSWWVNLFGHAHPQINAALREQLDRLEHVMLAGCTHAPAVELAERLGALAPGRLGHAFFASDGASATEIALKMAFHYWSNRGVRGKNRFVSLEGGYHGETVGALAVTDVALFRDVYAPLLRAGLVAPFPARASSDEGGGGRDDAIDAAGALERLFADAHHEIAALIVEPLVQGASGMRFYHPEYLRRCREL